MLMLVPRITVAEQIKGHCNRIAEISLSYRKSVSRNTMMMLDFRPEVGLWPYLACTIKRYNITLI